MWGTSPDGVDFGEEGAVVVAVDFGMLEKLAGRDVPFEVLTAEKIVVAAVPLTFPRRAGRAGDRVVGFAAFGEAPAEGCFAGPGWAGNEEDDAGAL